MSAATPVRVSIRLRLTLWNTAVLALLLISFAVTGWILLRRVLGERSIETVRESARSIAGAVIAERRTARERGDTTRFTRAAARDVLRELRSGDFDVLIVDDAARVVAATLVPPRAPMPWRTDTPATITAAPFPALDPDSLSLPPAVRDLLKLRPVGDEVLLRTVTIDGMPWRAAMVRVSPGPDHPDEPALIVSVLRSDEQDRLVLARVRTTLFFAIPFALVVTVVAGYALARRSLAPVEKMAATAARISAVTLNERLPVSNPHDELGRLATVVNDLLGRVDAAFRTQRQFVADASHELRTPIAIVRGEADVTLQRPTRDEGAYREALSVIRDESRRLTRIVDDLFLLARTDAAGSLDRHEPLDLGELLTTGLRSVRTIADERQVRLAFRPAPDVNGGVTVDGNPALLRRLLLNLLDNAIKQSPVGGEVIVTLEATPDAAVFCVSDAGPGVPPELRPRIFDRFVRGPVEGVDPASDGSGPIPTASGAGLGLAIAQAIAHAHHGHITLDDTTTGATFRVTLARF